MFDIGPIEPWTFEMSSYDGVATTSLSKKQKLEWIRKLANHLIENPDKEIACVDSADSFLVLRKRKDPVFGTEWYQVYDCKICEQGSALNLQDILK